MRVLDVQGTIENIFGFIGDKSQREIAKELNVSNTAVSKWKLGKTLPSVDTLVTMTELFDCALDDLVATKEI